MSQDNTSNIVSPQFTFVIEVDGFTAGSLVSDFCKESGIGYKLTTENVAVKKVTRVNSNGKGVSTSTGRRKDRVSVTRARRSEVKRLKRVNPHWTYRKIGAHTGLSLSSVGRVLQGKDALSRAMQEIKK